jgi:type I restriction enzyme S subunit
MSFPLIRLGEIATSIQYGLTASGSREPVGPRFLRITDIDDFGGLSDAEAVFVKADEAAIEKYRVRGGDLLIARSGATAGRAFVVTSDAEGWVFASYMIRFTLNHDVTDPGFLQQFCLSPFYRFQIDRIARGAAQPNVNSKELARLQIPLPPLSEQRRIVEILNEARDIRRLRQQADDLTTQLIPAIFNEMFGDPVGEVSSAERTPVSAFVAEMAGGKSLGEDPSGTKYRVVKVSAVTWGKFQPDESKYVDDKYVPLEEHFVRKGDLLFSRANTEELVGATVLVDDDYPDILLSDKIWRFTWKNPDEVNPYYMLALFQHPSVRREISNNATGTGGSMKNISKAKLMSIRVKLAPYEAQSRFGETVQEISSLHLDERDYRSLMQSLLAYAFSGELTADWRDAHREQLAQEAAERDQWLRENGVKLTATDYRSQGAADQTGGLAWELNSDQKALLKQLQQLDRNDSGGLFTLSSLALTAPLDKLPRDSIRRHLDVLSARGLVLSVSRRAGTSENLAFGNVYRLPVRGEDIVGTGEEPDHARLLELDRLSRQGRVIRASFSDQLELTDSVGGAKEVTGGDD